MQSPEDNARASGGDAGIIDESSAKTSDTAAIGSSAATPLSTRRRRPIFAGITLLPFLIILEGAALHDATLVAVQRTARGLRLAGGTPEKYGDVLRACAAGGPRLKSLVAQVPPGPPVRRLAELYQLIKSDFKYRKEPKDFWLLPPRDWMAPADDIARHGLSGDCVAYSIVMAAAAQDLLGLRWRIVTTRPNREHGGHAYPAVLVSDQGLTASEGLLQDVGSAFGSPGFVSEDVDHTVWLSLDRDFSAVFSDVQCAFYSDGRLWCDEKPDAAAGQR